MRECLRAVLEIVPTAIGRVETRYAEITASLTRVFTIALDLPPLTLITVMTLAICRADMP